MTVKDLWAMWGELRMKTVVDIYTSDDDIRSESAVAQLRNGEWR